jgi:hypothetical protein
MLHCTVESRPLGTPPWTAITVEGVHWQCGAFLVPSLPFLVEDLPLRLVGMFLDEGREREKYGS